ncbi:hypothetical protein ONZ43_g4895 [Nemania bipapillata]|uniref:Uncharacterized protein n=1 Tax=Nemania bipapillata TaxID=110536 RepID=A0ACC2IH55_9PEZI|nr:hypothetical protein ONZ43_g4895 [Nemania bipapillata]
MLANVPSTLLRAYMRKNEEELNDYRYGTGTGTRTSSLSVGLQQLGAFVACFLAWPLTDKLGRKKALMLSAFVFTIGAIIQTINTHSLTAFYIARVIAGLGLGSATVVVPMFNSEMMPKELRGQVGSFFQWFYTFGIFVSYFVDYGVARGISSHRSAQWQIPIGLQIAPAAFLGFGMLTLPESTRWLTKKGRHDEAWESLRWIRADSSQTTIEEMEEIRIGAENFKRVLAAFAVFTAQQATGATAFAYFGPQYFKLIVGSGDRSLLVTAIFGAVKVVACGIFVLWFSERLSRRQVLIGGAVVMSACQITTAAVVKSFPAPAEQQETVSPPAIATIALIYLFVVAYNFSWGPMPWPYVSEIFSARIREPGIAIGVASQWLWNFVFSLTTPYMIASLGWGTFLVWGHVLDRREQLPQLAETNRSTSGIWAPTIRYESDTKTFWLVTTLVNDDRPDNDASRWDNIIFKSKNPFNPRSWSKAAHFDFEGYDTSPFWDVDGKTYIVGAHAWRVSPGIMLAEADLETGKVGEWKTIWEGTGGSAPEGPHIYHKDGWYYLLVAEGGTGLNHMVTMARSRSLYGPWDSNPANPVLTNANTTEYFQTVGHADLFQDPSNNWWGVALSTRAGPEYLNFPMVRETIMVPVKWERDKFPVWSPVRGVMSGWAMPRTNREISGAGPFITEGDTIDFEPGTTLPAHFTHWRYPIPESYVVSPPEKPNTLRLSPSRLNLTALNGNYAGPDGQTFVGRRQQDTLFTFSVDMEFPPISDSNPDSSSSSDPTELEPEAEAGVSVFLTQNHHLDLGVVMLADTASSADTSNVANASEAVLAPHFRFRGISYVPVPSDVVIPVPPAWRDGPLRLEIRASNVSHYVFSAGPAGAMSRMKTVLEVSNEPVSWGFTGEISWMASGLLVYLN